MTHVCVLFFILTILYTQLQLYYAQSDRKSSLTFVIDVTRSMKSVISQVEQHANAIFDAALESNEPFIENFVLVTFADTEFDSKSINNVTDTRDKDEFRDSFKLTLTSGDDCPETSLSGILTGIERSAPGSTIYIFTDASAKDFALYDLVKDKAQKKEIQLVFFLTNKCNPSKYGVKGYNVYEDLARDTTGHVFNIPKDQIVDILEFVDDNIVSRRIILAAKSFPPGKGQLNYTTDHDTSDTTITISCMNTPKMSIEGPDGEMLEIKNLVKLDHVMVSKVNETKLGTQTVTIDCKTESRVVVTVKSKIQFLFGFSGFVPTSSNDTTVQPYPDGKTYLSIKIVGNFLPQIVELIDVNNSYIPGYTMTLKAPDDAEDLFVTDAFKTPSSVFRIVVSGVNLDYNETINRIGTTLVGRQSTKLVTPKERKPMILIDRGPKIVVDLNTLLQLKCSVNAYPKPTITWTKNGKTVEIDMYGYDTPYDYVSVYKIDKVNGNSTYKCIAENIKGSDEQSVVVEVKFKVGEIVKEAPILDKTIKSMTFQEGTNANISCRIKKGTPKPTIEWFYNDKVSSTFVKINVTEDQDDLVLENLNRTQAGAYKCVATNEVDSDSMELTLVIEYAPTVESIFKQITVKYDEEVTLSCSTDGFPKPAVKWSKGDKPLPPKFVLTSDQHLKFKADFNDSGVYQCISSNKLGTDMQFTLVKVEKSPIVLIKGSDPINAEYGKPLQLTCEVLGYPAPDIVWIDINNGAELKTEVKQQTPHQFASFLIIDKLTKNATYQCKANNTLGANEAKITVQAVKKATFDVLESPANKVYHIAYNSAQSFVCKADAYPPAEVNWYKNGHILSKNYTSVSSDGILFTIKQMDPMDVGKYMCEIKNIHNHKNYPFEIQISGVAKPKISATPKILNVPENLTTKLSCRIEEGTPKPTIKWYSKIVSGIEVEIEEARDEEILILANIKRTNQGKYVCVAENVVGSVMMETDLVVEYAPTIHDNSETMAAKVDSKVILTCVANGNPPPNIEWTKDHTILTHSKFTTGSDHSVSFKVDVEDRGIYKCIASNALGTAIKTVTLGVEKPPTVFIEGDLKQQVDIDETLHLKCNVHGYPPPDIRWTDTTNLATLSSSTSIVKLPYEYLSILSIDKVNKNASYQCEAKNIHGNGTASVMVEAMMKKHLDFIEKPKDTEIIYLTEGKLFCYVDAYPPAIIQWYKDSNRLTSSSGIQISSDGSVLTFEEMQPIHQGKYVCAASNSKGTKVSTAQVTISGVGLPSIDTDPTSYAVKAGDAVSIPCAVHGKPTPRVQWTKYRSTEDLPLTTEDHSLQINTTLSDVGLHHYICTATNMYGDATRTVKLHVYTIGIKKRGRGKKREVKEDQTLKLECIASGKPKPTIEWFYKGSSEKPKDPPLKLKAQGSQLVIEPIRFSDRGFYTCVAINSLGGQATFTYEVQVNKAVEIINKDGIVKAVDGDMVLKITCQATGYPKPYYKWTINGAPNSEVSDTIFINHISKRHHLSEILCEAVNDIGDTDTFTFTVEVGDYPSLNNPNMTLKVDSGQIVHVTCPVSHETGDFLRWYKGNKKIHEGELYVYNAESYNAGLYTCRVSNSAKSESANVLLEVASKLRFMNTDVKTSISLGFEEIADLDCMVVSEDTAKVLWYFNGKNISNVDFLTFKMDQSKLGKYRCEATNDFDRISRDFEVTLNECLLKIDPNDSNKPLILTQSLSWPTYKFDAGYLYIPKRQSIKLVCQSTSKLNIFNHYYIDAYCNETGGFTRLDINEKPYDYTNIKCTEDLKPQVKWTGKSCYDDDSEKVEIVFEVVNRNIPVYEACMNLSSDLPLYTKQNLQLTLADTVPKRAVWFNERLPYNFDKFYDKAEQIMSIPQLARHSCVYTKRQLVNPLDVFPGVPQRATFTHFNVVPHWSTCSSKNWDTLESNVRRLAHFTNGRLVVWTGTVQNLKLKNAWGDEEDIVISNQDDSSNQPVSTYLWKVVQNPAKRSSLAIIQLNIPDITDAEARKYVKCTDICKHIVWMSGTQWSDASKGYTFCCYLKDFKEAFDIQIFGYGMEDLLRV